MAAGANSQAVGLMMGQIVKLKRRRATEIPEPSDTLREIAEVDAAIRALRARKMALLALHRGHVLATAAALAIAVLQSVE